ncbi:ATP synthase subunit I [Paenibacillus sp. J5C_2022]|uniref:ATP synthase subunit I n=1 Tax=Paenibacillus sp. J5C2022 TaxID=2977129 RepID=UPI0021D1D45C|nr:ATP synthase subunit I [Paenibacillus sp. J5C2022]MCU6708510.1 ATP synthase subunit I [Paenibacillus sp. J5C2022]
MDNIFKTAMRTVLILAAACLLLWGILPSYRAVFAGLLLGVAASSLNALLLRRRVEMVARSMANRSVRRMGLGLGSRMAMVLLVAMIAYRYPETFNLPAALAASMVMPFIVLVSAFIWNKRQ